MSLLDDTARAAAADLRRSTAPDVDRLLDGIPLLDRRRRLTRAAASAVVVAVLVLVAALLVRPGGDDSVRQLPADPSPSGAVDVPYATRLLPPLCGPSVLGTASATSDRSQAPCPPTVDAGDNAGMVFGLNYARRFHVTVPGAGWAAASVGRFLGVELTRPDGAGLTVFPYPAVVGHAGSIGGWRRIDSQLRARGDVEVSTWTAVELGGLRFHQADLGVAAGAALSRHCRLVAPCLRVMTTVIPEPGLDVVELRPGVTARVLVEDSQGGTVETGVWVHDVSGPGAAASLAVLASLRVGPAVLPPDAP